MYYQCLTFLGSLAPAIETPNNDGRTVWSAPDGAWASEVLGANSSVEQFKKVWAVYSVELPQILCIVSFNYLRLRQPH
jgi:hypothetical protein